MTLKQGILCAGIYLASSVLHITASANGSSEEGKPSTPSTAAPTSALTASTEVDVYINSIYASISFGKNKPDVAAFNAAMRGYLNLKAAGKLGSRGHILSLVDFTKSSTQDRLWIIDLKAGKVLYNTYVAHGQGSGSEFATAFSNTNNSHQSSLGFYVTGETYVGGHGTSLRLLGMDAGFNNAALERGVVVHGADYISDSYVKSNNRLGRSWGCPAVASNLAQPIINAIKGGSVMFIYANDKKFAKSSVWLNRMIAKVPAVPGESKIAATIAAPVAPAASSTAVGTL